jgi:hypothetical protein
MSLHTIIRSSSHPSAYNNKKSSSTMPSTSRSPTHSSGISSAHYTAISSANNGYNPNVSPPPFESDAVSSHSEPQSQINTNNHHQRPNNQHQRSGSSNIHNSPTQPILAATYHPPFSQPITLPPTHDTTSKFRFFDVRTWNIYYTILVLLLATAISLIIWMSYELWIEKPEIYRQSRSNVCLSTGECLVYSDEFTSSSASATTISTVDTSSWAYDITMSGGGNSEFQIYAPDSDVIYVSNGTLKITPSLTRDWVSKNQGVCTNGFGTFEENCELNLYGIYGRCTTADINYACRASSCLSTCGNVLKPIRSAKISSSHAIKYGRIEVRAKLPIGDWLWPAIWMVSINTLCRREYHAFIHCLLSRK